MCAFFQPLPFTKTLRQLDRMAMAMSQNWNRQIVHSEMEISNSHSRKLQPITYITACTAKEKRTRLCSTWWFWSILPACRGGSTISMWSFNRILMQRDAKSLPPQHANILGANISSTRAIPLASHLALCMCECKECGDRDDSGPHDMAQNNSGNNPFWWWLTWSLVPPKCRCFCPDIIRLTSIRCFTKTQVMAWCKCRSG